MERNFLSRTQARGADEISFSVGRSRTVVLPFESQFHKQRESGAVRAAQNAITLPHWRGRPSVVSDASEVVAKKQRSRNQEKKDN